MEPNEGENVVYPMDFYTAGTPWAVARAKGKAASLAYE